MSVTAIDSFNLVLKLQRPQGACWAALLFKCRVLNSIFQKTEPNGVSFYLLKKKKRKLLGSVHRKSVHFINSSSFFSNVKKLSSELL